MAHIYSFHKSTLTQQMINRKWARELNRHFSEKNPVRSINMKRHLNSFVIGKIKTTISYHNIQEQVEFKNGWYQVLWGCGVAAASYSAGRSVRWYSPFWNSDIIVGSNWKQLTSALEGVNVGSSYRGLFLTQHSEWTSDIYTKQHEWMVRIQCWMKRARHKIIISIDSTYISFKKQSEQNYNIYIYLLKYKEEQGNAYKSQKNGYLGRKEGSNNGYLGKKGD